MSRLPGPCDHRANEDTALIQAKPGIIQDKARVLKDKYAYNDELHEYYSDLRAHCLTITDGFMQRIAGAGIGSTRELVEFMTERFGAIISSTTSVETRLRELQNGWTEVHVKGEEVETDFIHAFLAFGDRKDRCNIMDSLKQWDKDLKSRYPEDRSSWASDDLVPWERFGKPSYTVGIAAEDLFNALEACQKCDCLPAHNFGAILGLGTYRKSKDDNSDEKEIEFDIFLSTKEYWQEARVYTTMKGAVGIAVEGQSPREPPEYPAARGTPVKHLCKSIDKARRSMDTDNRLELNVMQGQMSRLKSKESNHQVDPTPSPVTLHELLQKEPQAFTDNTKLILSVLLGYAALHLHDTPWLKPTWSSSTILFFRTSDSQIRLRPFLQTDLSRSFDEEGMKTHGQQQGQDSGEPDKDKFDPDDLVAHTLPTLVMLAITLMEVYFMTPFPELARRFDVTVETDASNLTKFLNACHLFRAGQEHMFENIGFFYAVRNCLDPRIWEDDNGNMLGLRDLRNRIYDEIVIPLENNLSMAYRSISIEKLDQVVQTLNLGSWAQEIRRQPAQSRNSKKHLSQDRRRPTSVPSRLENLPPMSTAETPSSVVDDDDLAPKFFDDETPLDGHSPQACQTYLRWKSEYRSTYKRFISNHCTLRPIKIAILDTGVDLGHPDMQACKDNIRAYRDWLRNGVNTTVPDLNGHGTFVTSLLLDYAPDAEIYVAKIADREPANPRVIAKAIEYAVYDWKVDVISMSFGFPRCDIDGYAELEESIVNAYSQHVLLFAAASNSGAQHGRAYPARDANVVCVNSVNVHGNRSAFSPTAASDGISLATVGEAVKSAWPRELCSEGELATCTAVKSGTSYATPIMAGIAAFLLTYARLYLPEKAHKLRRRSRMVQLMRRIALKDDGGIRDGYHFVDIRLHPDSLFGKDKEFIDRTIGDILDG